MLGAVTLAGVLSCYQHVTRDAPLPSQDEARSAEMLSIPAGDFTLGDISGAPEEHPERRIYLDAFQIDRTEVSNAAYRRCVRARACDASAYLDDPSLGKDDRPVVGATFQEAEVFCRWLKRRLPTEAEWEYAAKGQDHRKWPWRGAFDPKRANSISPDDPHTHTAPVDAYEEGKSPFGVLNMAGNVAEWVADYFDPVFYQTDKTHQNPKGPRRGRERVVRGGSYREPAFGLRVSARRGQLPTEVNNTVGFRCAR